MIQRTVWDEIDDTPKKERDLGIVRIKKEIQIKEKEIKKEKIIKKFAKLPKKKKGALLQRLLNKRLRLRKLRRPQQKTNVTFQRASKPVVIKTRQPNEPSHYFKHSDNQEAKFIGKYKVK